MAAEGFPVARIDEYAKPCEPAIPCIEVSDFAMGVYRLPNFDLLIISLSVKTTLAVSY